jgi:hypothetical protein
VLGRQRLEAVEQILQDHLLDLELKMGLVSTAKLDDGVSAVRRSDVVDARDLEQRRVVVVLQQVAFMV